MHAEKQSLGESVEAMAKEPLTAKEKIGAIVVAVVLIGFCVAVWVLPDLVNIDTSELSGRRGRGIAGVLNFVWSRPLATVAGVIGLLVGVSALRTKVGA